MKEYEVTREIFNNCSRKFKYDASFEREIQTDNIETDLADWYGGILPAHEREVLPDGTISYTLQLELPERYCFCELK